MRETKTGALRALSSDAAVEIARETPFNPATAKKDELDDALRDFNRSTNRLRREFDATDKWMEATSEVQQVIDDGRRINHTVTKRNYGVEAAKL